MPEGTVNHEKEQCSDDAVVCPHWTKETITKYNEITLLITPGGTVVCPWWTEEAAEYLCDLCGCRNSKKCKSCLNKNRWCG